MWSPRVGLLSVRRGLPLFLVIVVGLAVYQVRLTWLLMEQDRNLAPQRIRDRLEQIADRVTRQFAGTSNAWEKDLHALESLPPPDAMKSALPPEATVVLFTPGSVALFPSKRLLFVPNPPSAAPLVGEPLNNADREIADPRYYSEGAACLSCDRAIESLLPLTDQPGTRAEALLRIARLEQKRNHSAAALEAYQRLENEPGVSSTGAPFALVAASERCDVLLNGGKRREVLSAAKAIHGDLLDGRWKLSREIFDYYWAEANRFGDTSGNPDAARIEFAAFVSRLYDEWDQDRLQGMLIRDPSTFGLTASLGQNSANSGSAWGRSLVLGGRQYCFWYGTPWHFAALFAPTSAFDIQMPPAERDVKWRVTFGLETGTLRSEFGPAPHVIRPLPETAGLPGLLEVWSVSADSRERQARGIWLAGVTLMLSLVLGGAYAVYRGLSKEFRVAQLQSDFVSAVSHEFRSPLTTLCTLTELLAENRIPTEARRQESYVFLERESARLKRLVDDLLDFGRMESATKEYRAEPNELFSLVRSAVADFESDALAAGFKIEVNLDEQAAMIHGDADALKCALRNLLENAAKYSPECRTIWVDGTIQEGQARISVRDRGIGVDSGERRDIFRKFVRGAAAKRAGIKGTGIGLSMVRQIVEAMGGKVRLESATGVGSTFTIVLPLVGVGEMKV